MFHKNKTTPGDDQVLDKDTLSWKGNQNVF